MQIKGSLEGHKCRDRKIITNQSYFSAAYEGSSSSGDLTVSTAKTISSLSDCQVKKIDPDSDACAANYIFNRLLKIYDVSGEEMQEYSIDVPGCEED